MLNSTLLRSGLLTQPRPLIQVHPKAPPDDPDVHYWLGYSGICTGHKRLFVFAPDDSYSVVGFGGNDPLSRRYAETRLAIRTLVRACTCGRELAAVCHWDRSRFDVPPVGFDWHGVVRLRDGLRLPDDAAGTSDLGPVLTRIQHLVRPWAWRGWDIHLIVLSDFELTDADEHGVFARFDQFAGRHQTTAVVSGGRVDPRLTDSPATVLPITAADPPGTLARAVFGVLKQGRTGQRM